MSPRLALTAPLFSAVALLLVIHSPAASVLQSSQENAARQVIQPQLNYEISVAVKSIEVIVRGKDGRWITGLQPANFKVYEDGILRKITNFHEVAGPRSGTTPGIEPGPGGPESRPAAVIPETIQNRIVFCFDNIHLHPMNRNLIVKKLGAFIARTFERGTTNQAMVVLLDRRLDIIQSFTSDAASLLAAVESLRDRASDAFSRTRTWDDVQQEISRMASQATAMGDDGNFQQAVSYAHGFIEEEMHQLDFTLRSLQALGNNLGGIKGRKMLIYASDRLPLNPAEEVFRFIGRLFPSMNAETEALVYDASRLFDQFIASCNAQEISVYSVQAQEFDLSASSAERTNWSVSAEGLRPINPGASRHNDGLEIVSRQTGGSVVTAKRDLAARFETMEDDLSNYYSLGYTSDAPADDSYHSINVKIVGAGEDCVLRFRTGYLKSSAEETVKSRVVARLFLPQKDNPLSAQVQVLPAVKQLFGQVKMSFKILIPIHQLSLRPSGSEQAGAIKIIVAMLDSKNLWSDPVELLQDIRIPNQDMEKARGRFYPYLAELHVKPERYTVSLAVQDIFGQRISYLQLDQDVR